MATQRKSQALTWMIHFSNFKGPDHQRRVHNRLVGCVTHRFDLNRPTIVKPHDSGSTLICNRASRTGRGCRNSPEWPLGVSPVATYIY